MSANLSKRLVLASGNAGKLQEFAQLLAPHSWQVVTQKELQVQEVAETGLTFVENALLKARNAAAQTGLPALADDSGLEVDALQGAPGIYSARYAPASFAADFAQPDAANNAYLLQQLAEIGAEQRSARFWCILVFLRNAHDPTPIIVQASWEGQILLQPRGVAGFGYDPLFWVPSLGLSAAELTAVQKNQLSHRGQASQQLVAALQERYANF